MSKKIISFCLLSGFLFSGVANANSETLKDAIGSLYQNNQKLKAESSRVKGSQAGMMESMLSVLPDIRYSEDVHQEATITLTTNQSFKPKYPKTRRTSLNQDISLSNTFMGPALAKKNVEFEGANFRLNEQNILLEGIGAYLGVLEKDEALRIANENYEITKKSSTLISKQFELGDTTKTQVEYTLSNLASRESIKIKAQGAVVSAKAKYKKIFGKDPSSLILPENLPKIPSSFEEFCQIAFKNNPYLKSSKIRAQIGKLNVVNASSAILPNLAVSYEKTRNDILDEFSDKVKIQEVYRVAVRVPILPRGGSEYARIISAKYNFNRSNALSAYAADELYEEIISSWENLIVSDANLNAATSAQTFAKSAMDAMRKEYEYGTKSVLELLEAEKQYFETSNSLVLARHQRIFARYQILSIMGLLGQCSFI